MGQRSSTFCKMRSAFSTESVMAHSIAQGVLPLSLSFRAARIVAAKDCVFLPGSSTESSSGNGEDSVLLCVPQS